MTHSELFRQIEELVPTLGDWSTPAKCCEFAAIVIATRPLVTVELGAWMGAGSFSLALAHRHINHGKCHVVDPWSAQESIVGMEGANAEWWGEQSKHELAHRTFTETQGRLQLEAWMNVQRTTSSSATLPASASLILIDGNHGPQAIADVERWAPIVTRSGYVYLDDLNWSEGHVAEAGKRLMALGFTPLWARDTGMFYQRAR